MSEKIITYIDLSPQRLVDPLTDKASWFVDETDERGVLYEAYEFETEMQADYFIRLWVEASEDDAKKFHKSL